MADTWSSTRKGDETKSGLQAGRMEASRAQGKLTPLSEVRQGSWQETTSSVHSSLHPSQSHSLSCPLILTASPTLLRASESQSLPRS